MSPLQLLFKTLSTWVKIVLLLCKFIYKFVAYFDVLDKGSIAVSLTAGYSVDDKP